MCMTITMTITMTMTMTMKYTLFDIIMKVIHNYRKLNNNTDKHG